MSLLALITGSLISLASPPEPGFRIHPRECENDYSILDEIEKAFSQSQETRVETPKVLELSQDLEIMFSPRSSVPEADRTWRSAILKKVDNQWVIEVNRIDGSTHTSPISESLVERSLRSLWKAYGLSTVEDTQGALLQNCDVGTCQEIDGKTEFHAVSDDRLPSPSPELNYVMEIRRTSDPDRKVKIDLYDNILGLRQSARFAAGSADQAQKRRARLPHFIYSDFCLLIERRDVCEAGLVHSDTAHLSPAVDLNAKEAAFAELEKAFASFTAEMHLNLLNALRTAQAEVSKKSK